MILAEAGSNAIRTLHAIVAWVGLSAVLSYLFANLKVAGEGAGEAYLLIAAGCIATIVGTKRHILAETLIRRSALFLLMFLSYFHLKALIDVSDAGELMAITIGTSGGLLFALLLGTLVAFSLSYASPPASFRRIEGLATLLFLLLSLLLAANIFVDHLAFIRQDLFLVDVANRHYQRAGDFLAMISLIISFALAKRYAHEGARRLLDRACAALSLLAYLLTSALLLVTSQLMGSNKGFAVTLLVVGGTLVWILRPPLAGLRWAAIFGSGSVNAVTAFGRSLPRLALTGVILGTLTSGLVLAAFVLTALDPAHFRIFGFSDGAIGGHSLGGRLELFSNNFVAQMAVNPVFGNLEADDLTTGRGTYAHSLISLLSHLGIVGTLLFSAYLGAVYVDLKKSKRFSGSSDDGVGFGIYKIMILSLLLCFSLVAAFFTWMPLWFGFGLFCSVFIVRDPGVPPFGAHRRTD